MPVEDDVAKLTREECRQELSEELDMDMLRALVAVRMILQEMAQKRVTGKLEGNVQDGKLKGWHYPRSIKL